jgi:hypothetical protein
MNLKNARLLRQYERLIAKKDEQMKPDLIKRFVAPIVEVLRYGTSEQKRKMANVIRSTMTDKLTKRARRRERAVINKAWNIAASRNDA